MRTTAMNMLIIIAAQFLNFVLATIGLTEGIGNLIEGLGLGKYGTMLLIVVPLLTLEADARGGGGHLAGTAAE